MIFPELKNINILTRLGNFKKSFLNEKDFIFLISLMIIDDTDNADYFLFKFNISKKDQRRIKIIDNFFKDKINSKSFSINNLNKIFYYNGRQTVLDILNFKIVKSKKIEQGLVDLTKHYSNNLIPEMPVSASLLMKKYQIPEGKQLGEKLKIIEEEWVKNNFKISDLQVDEIVNS